MCIRDSYFIYESFVLLCYICTLYISLCKALCASWLMDKRYRSAMFNHPGRERRAIKNSNTVQPPTAVDRLGDHSRDRNDARILGDHSRDRNDARIAHLRTQYYTRLLKAASP